jgi:tetratricopeptide (TPR) repeat protein
MIFERLTPSPGAQKEKQKMSEVKVWEESVVIPTYEVGAPDKNPMFLEKRVYQGSSGKIYPYPSTNEISRTKTDKAWKALWLENDYLKVMILPELGGRIQRAYDKTNGYDFVYYNHVIKPALVGLTGPWISGGIEFNWPQHHRPTTYMPVNYRLAENSDGSRSVLLGDVDRMYGTKELTKITLYPDKAYIEIMGQLYNRTPLPQTFLWWANPAVSVNDYTQSVFPPDVHSVYDHGKRAVSRFPIATGEYYKYDYSEGVDISRYKNIPVPTSYMAERSDYNFVGGYDYQKKAGLLHVADHHVSPGKKQWTWGCGDFGKAWDRNLTDEDGPYIELMTGMYCDNQPDFSWLKPYEEKVFKQYFMPYKQVGYVKNASVDCVLNTEKRGGKLYVCAYGTSPIDATIVVTYDKKEIYREDTKLSPTEVYEKELDLDVTDEYKVKVSVRSGKRELISYQPKDQGIPVLAEPAKAAKEPQEIMTNEELYLTGQHIEQYRHATWLPDPYYLEGLKRDPDDTRINNAYGLLLMRRGCFEESEKYFRRALKRLTLMHPNPYDSEPYYNLGLSLFAQERFEDAYDAFYKATWVNELREMSFYYLSAVAVRKNVLDEALEFIEKALVKNAHSIKARGLKAAILLKTGRKEEANAWIRENLDLDAFDYVSLYLRLSAADEKDRKPLLEDLIGLTGGDPEIFLNIARDLAEWGLYEEAVGALGICPKEHPLILYYKGAYLKKAGKDAESTKSFKAAEKCDPAYCFPNKLEDISVLTEAMNADPEGAKAPYYLGCLFYDKLQYDRAIELWEKSLDLDDTYPTLLRNLSVAYYNKRNDKEKARKCMERAFALDETDARVFLELDQLYQKLGVSLEERLAGFKAHIGLIEKRDDLYTEYVTLLNSLGMYGEAYERITGHSFQTWEGAEGKITAQFKVCLLQMAKEKLAAGDTKEAERLLKEAVSYPENLGEGKLEGTKDNHIYYTLGLVYEREGRKEEAAECFEKATLGAMEVAGMMYYYDQPADMILYQGLAKEKLGDKKAANARFYRLMDYGEQHLHDVFKMDYFAVSMPDMSVFDADMNAKNEAHCHYLMGLANLGLKNKEKATECFKKVLAIDNTHQNAILYM